MLGDNIKFVASFAIVLLLASCSKGAKSVLEKAEQATFDYIYL